MLRFAFALPVCFLFATALGAQTQVVLPDATGHLTAPAEWTVLQGSSLAAKQRSSDPPADPARAIVQAVVERLQKDQRTDQHAVLHSVTADGKLRLLNAWSVAGTVTSDKLLQAETVASMQKALADEYASTDTKTTFHDHRTSDLFAIPALALQFTQEGAGMAQVIDHYTVPAGDRIQYFETMHDASDTAADAAFAAMLRTFDGAREGKPDDTTRNMLIGGVAGGIAGMLAGGWWRKRRRALLAQPAPTTR